MEKILSIGSTRCLTALRRAGSSRQREDDSKSGKERALVLSINIEAEANKKAKWRNMVQLLSKQVTWAPLCQLLQ